MLMCSLFTQWLEATYIFVQFHYLIGRKMEATIVGEEIIRSQNSVWTISECDVPNTMLLFVEVIFTICTNIFYLTNLCGRSLSMVDKNCWSYKIVFPLRIIFSCVKGYCNTDLELWVLYYQILPIIKIRVDATRSIIRAHLTNAFTFFWWETRLFLTSNQSDQLIFLSFVCNSLENVIICVVEDEYFWMKPVKYTKHLQWNLTHYVIVTLIAI